MYHSVIFGEKHTYDDWRLVPTERPVIVPPTQKTNFIDVPGADGSLDVSDALTGYPIYNDREGSLSFYVLNEYDGYNYANVYSDVMTNVHGKRLRMILEDDPGWYYDGRFWVDNWTPDSYHSKISIKYRVDPYKWSTTTSIDSHWYWSTFNFETDVITSTEFVNIPVASNSSWTVKNYSQGTLGLAPTLPKFTVRSNNGRGMDIFIRNISTNTYADAHFPDGTSSNHRLMITNGDISIGFKGAGTVTMDFRMGKL